MTKYVCMQEVPEELYEDEQARAAINDSLTETFDHHLEMHGLTKNRPWDITWFRGMPKSYENSYDWRKWLWVQIVVHVLWRARVRVKDPRTYTEYWNWMARGVTDVTPPEEEEHAKGAI